MTGVLLINLGTPDAPTTTAVRRYLRQFLSDPLVLDINPVARFFLVNFMIAPFRAPKSVLAYQKIWTNEGSPLFVNTKNLATEVQKKLSSQMAVTFAMRYGNPSIEVGMRALFKKGIHRLIVLPLYPQYATSSTESSLHEVYRVKKKIKPDLPMQVIPSFYNHPGFIEAFAERGREVLNRFKADHVLFSFHGLPEQHIKKLDSTCKHCLVKPDCCKEMEKSNKNCYRAQCFKTAFLIAKKLGLKNEETTVSFQSRLGRLPWIKPYTDLVIPQLAKKGIQRLAVFCPAFVADCLETLEEIEIRGRDLFLGEGGDELKLISSLNAQPLWIEAVCHMVLKIHCGTVQK